MGADHRFDRALAALHHGSVGCVPDTLGRLLSWHRQLAVPTTLGTLIGRCLLCRACIAVLETRSRTDGDVSVECPPDVAETIARLMYAFVTHITSLPESTLDDQGREIALGLHAQLLGEVAASQFQLVSTAFLRRAPRELEQSTGPQFVRLMMCVQVSFV